MSITPPTIYLLICLSFLEILRLLIISIYLSIYAQNTEDTVEHYENKRKISTEKKKKKCTKKNSEKILKKEKQKRAIQRHHN